MCDSYTSDVFDTMLALEACINAEEVYTETVRKGIAYLIINQTESGAYSYADEEENIYLTAYAVSVFMQYIKVVGRNDESAKCKRTTYTRTGHTTS